MMTVKEVSKLTGVSVRMLYYYDKIGLFKPSKINESGYRLYDDNDLSTLQQILFFKELEVPLKEIRDIMNSPYFDKIKTLENQKKLLTLKRDRLNGLIELIDKTIKGENAMSFEEFDTTEFYKVWEDYRNENKERVIDTFGSYEKFDNKFGEGAAEFTAKVFKINLENKKPKLEKLYESLASKCDKEPGSTEVQDIVLEIVKITKENNKYYNIKQNIDYKGFISNMSDMYFRIASQENNAVDKLYGKGAAKLIGEAFKYYSEN